eukprot:SAG22_NODE_245_length_13962_cov_11.954555_9_plen_181_part_00
MLASSAPCLAFRCRVKCQERLAANSQPGTEHWYGRSPVCLRMCAVRWPDCAAAYEQPGHAQTNGFSPVCVRMWRGKCPDDADSYLQSFQVQQNILTGTPLSSTAMRVVRLAGGLRGTFRFGAAFGAAPPATAAPADGGACGGGSSGCGGCGGCDGGAGGGGGAGMPAAASYCLVAADVVP